jgi:hypothetical protein
MLGSLVVKTRVLLVLAALAGGALEGCKSDQTVICERLDDCHLLPKSGPTAQDPDGFGVNDCEYQVENELNESFRQQCSECVTAHPCAEIQDACRTVCNPPY